MSNALASATSAYLRQHAENPVDWRPWGQDAFDEARRRQVPVLISIGYSTCHWCHVMAHECFEDPATAAVMNQRLVCIKVDREEHPEVDAIYMDAVQALHGHGGWPLNAFADHEGRPFYACTYVPRGSWSSLVEQIASLWSADRERIARAANDILAHIGEEPAGHGSLDEGVWQALDSQLDRAFDNTDPGWAWGGQRSPKFPPSQLLALLLARGGGTRLKQAEAVLEAMQDSGLHDRVGGGFHRYSVDQKWRVPHFEKMLYDNAQLIVAYARAGIQLGRPDFLTTAVNAGDYLLRDLRITDAEGLVGYASAEDADDPGGEGSFYAWSPAQLAEQLGEDEATRLAAEWDLHPGEQVSGHSGHPEPVASHIPHPRGGAFARLSPAERQQARLRWEPLLPRLRAGRAKRPRPGRDDKLLTDQNGLALEAFAVLGRMSGEERFIKACRELCATIGRRQGQDGLRRLPHLPAYITDYGSSVTGLLAAFDCLGDPGLVDLAMRIAEEAVERLHGGDGGFFCTPEGRTDLVRRSREFSDNAWPGGQNALTLGMIRLWNLTGIGRWKALAEGVFSVSAAAAARTPSAMATLLMAWRAARLGHRSVVVTGPLEDATTGALLAGARRWTDPTWCVVPAAACPGRAWPVLDGRGGLPPQALVCLERRCLAPALHAEDLRERAASAAAG